MSSNLTVPTMECSKCGGTRIFGVSHVHDWGDKIAELERQLAALQEAVAHLQRNTGPGNGLLK